MTKWTIEDVAARFEEAASTSRRLPPVRVQGYFNCWPAIVRSEWETFAADERVYRSVPLFLRSLIDHPPADRWAATVVEESRRTFQ